MFHDCNPPHVRVRSFGHRSLIQQFQAQSDYSCGQWVSESWESYFSPLASAAIFRFASSGS